MKKQVIGWRVRHESDGDYWLDKHSTPRDFFWDKSGQRGTFTESVARSIHDVSGGTLIRVVRPVRRITREELGSACNAFWACIDAGNHAGMRAALATLGIEVEE